MIFTWSLKALPQMTGSENIIWLISHKRLWNCVKSIFYYVIYIKAMEWYNHIITNSNPNLEIEKFCICLYCLFCIILYIWCWEYPKNVVLKCALNLTRWAAFQWQNKTSTNQSTYERCLWSVCGIKMSTNIT